MFSLSTLALMASVAHAQEFDAHGFHMAPQDGDVRDSVSAERPGAMTSGDWYAGGMVEYAKSPLIEVREVAGTVTEITRLDNLVALNLSAGYTVHDRIRLDLRIPLFLASTGVDGYQGVDTGVLRLSSMVSLLAPGSDGGLGLGVVPYLDLPTGSEAFLNTGKAAGGVKLGVTYETGDLTLTGNVGGQLNPETQLENLIGDDSLIAALGGSYLVSPSVALGLEGVVKAPFAANAQPGTNTPAEVLLSARGRTEAGGHWIAGGAVGVTSAASAAAFRLFVGGGFGKITRVAVPVLDTDGDGLLDNVDECVTEPETMNDFEDGDGCPDSTDGSLLVDVTLGGEHVDGAAVVLTGPDGPESFDLGKAPMAKADLPEGSAFTATATKGACLAGQGSAEVPRNGEAKLVMALERVIAATATVAVIDEAGAPVPTANIRWQSDDASCIPEEAPVGPEGKLAAEMGAGTHTLVVDAADYGHHIQEVVVVDADVDLEVVLKAAKVQIEGEKILILDKVFFETAKDVIKAQSYALLDEVSNTIRANPQIGRVEVSGHTDSQGDLAYNIDLSERRAAAVMQYLIDKGVPAARLTAVGHGPNKPVADNSTAAGMAENRRVEFHILGE